MIYYPFGASRRNREYESRLAAMGTEEREAAIKASQDAAMRVIALFCLAGIVVIVFLLVGGVWSHYS